MKAIVKSIMMIAMVAVMTVGATSAAWSDEVDTGVQAASGDADLQIGEDAQGPWNDAVVDWWTLEDMYPGGEEQKVFYLYNDSSAPIDFQTYVRVENWSGNTGDYTNYVQLKLEWWDDTAGDWTSTPYWSLNYWKNTASTWHSGRGEDMNVVGPSTNNPRQYRAYLKLAENTPNEHQDKSVDFTMVFHGAQVLP